MDNEEIYAFTTYHYECPSCGEINDIDESEWKSVEDNATKETCNHECECGHTATVIRDF